MKVNDMTYLNENSVMPLTAMFGHLAPATPKTTKAVTLKTGWVDLTVGRSDRGEPFVIASTPWWDRFVAMHAPAARPSLPLRSNCRPWVYTLRKDPEQYLKSRVRPAEVTFAGFRIVHGVDRRRRQFAYVVTPELKQILLFRNPRSRAVLPWCPADAVELKHGMAWVPPEAKAQPKVEEAQVSTGDRDLDDLLNQLFLA